MHSEIVAIFPTPVMVIDRPEPLSSVELEFIKRHENKQNELMQVGTLNEISKNSYILNEPEMANLKRFCQEGVNKFTKEIYSATEDELNITISWINIVRSGRAVFPHKHKNSIVSGVYYYENTEEFPLAFETPLENNVDFSELREYNPFNSEEFKITSTGNQLVLFPSWLNHRVLNDTNATRSGSIAFNSFFKPNKDYGFAYNKTLVNIKG